MAIVLAGLAYIAETFSLLLIAIKWAGVAYLCWLAYRFWTSREGLNIDEGEDTGHGANAFISGVLVTIGNPKSILFYVSIVPTVLDLHEVTLLDGAVLVLLTALILSAAQFPFAIAGARAVCRSVAEGDAAVQSWSGYRYRRRGSLDRLSQLNARVPIVIQSTATAGRGITWGTCSNISTFLPVHSAFRIALMKLVASQISASLMKAMLAVKKVGAAVGSQRNAETYIESTPRTVSRSSRWPITQILKMGITPCPCGQRRQSSPPWE
nr:LysE family translocator [Rhizobium laguerreae]